MSTEEKENNYWQIPDKDAAIQVRYRYDENEGKIVIITDKHDESGHLILQQAWDTYGERADEARKQVLAGLKSPLYYQMEKIGMELSILSATVSLSQWRIKRHFKPPIYKKMSRQMLERYANAFDLKVEDLDKLD
jgi:hypothetical protein